MHVRPLLTGLAPLALAALVACGPTHNGGGDGGTGLCGSGCPTGQICVNDLGCRVCQPGYQSCSPDNDHDIVVCKDDGSGYDVINTCPADQACLDGNCLTACDAAELDPSSVGCHFFAVDLDNEAVTTLGGITNDAAAQQFAVAVANVNAYDVRVDVYKNVANYGQPVSEQMVTSVMVPANDLKEIDLPQREVDGTMGQNGTYAMDQNDVLGTFVSSHAYKIDSTGPIVAVQFQPIIQQFSNDASLLLPRQAVGTHYTVMGYPTANPCGAPPGDQTYQQSIPDHTFVTIVGVHENTHVTVVPTHPVMASAGPSGVSIPETPAGTPMTFTVGPYDVVNLESDQPQVSLFDCLNYIAQDGDFSGTTIESDQPVMVFSGNERGIGTGGANPPNPPNFQDDCCTDHLEEQLLPTEAWGSKYAISRSPIRSTGGYVEPDIYRVLAFADNTDVTTSLPSPFDHFTLNAGEFKALYAYTGFTVQSSNNAIQVGQYLVSQGLTDGGIGDPSFTIFPAVDQHRDHYVFLVPTTFQDNYMVVTMPSTSGVLLDGATEFPPTCDMADIGTIDGVDYQQWTCKLDPGVHHINTSEPSGLTVYGYYSVGSYAFVGGSDVDIINPIQ